MPRRLVGPLGTGIVRGETVVLKTPGGFEPAVLPIKAAGPVTHSGSGALVGAGAIITGTGAEYVKHTGSGTLVGSGSTVTGTGTRFRAFSGSGALVGSGSTITGTGSNSPSFVTHTGSGALIGAGPVVTGTGLRTLLHTSTGVLVGSGTTLSGTGAHYVKHTGSGSLVGSGSTVTGTGTRFRAFSGSGALIGQGSTITGTATRFRAFSGSGALIGSGASINGTGIRFRAFTGSGALVGSGSTLSGTGLRTLLHDSTGELVGSGSTVDGAGTHLTTHTGSGDLVGSGATVDGTGAHLTTHSGSGALVGSGAVIDGTGAYTITPSCFSSQERGWLRDIARLHGLIHGEPLVVSATARSAGVVTQTVSGTDPVIVTTTASTNGAVDASDLTAYEHSLLERLARVYGLIDPLTVDVTTGTRDDGTLYQTIDEASGTTTVTYASDPVLLSVVSRKTHGSAGDFDISLDQAEAIGGSITVEPRTNTVAHQIVFTFDRPILDAGTPTSLDSIGGAFGTPTASASGNSVIVSIAGAPTQKRAVISLTGVNGTVSASINVGFLIGDYNGNRIANTSDILLMKGKDGQVADATNFRADTNLDGIISAVTTGVGDLAGLDSGPI